MVRDLKEDPWDLMRSMARLMPRTEKACMGGGVNLNPLGAPTRPNWASCSGRSSARSARPPPPPHPAHIQVVCNTADQIERQLPVIMPFFRGLGMKVACALSYSISPRHTDDHYAEKTRALLPFKPDVIYLKDQSGLLTVDRLRSILPAIQANAGNIPIELHSHCTTGLAPLVYMEALKLGVLTIHTGVPPLAEGAAQPFGTADPAQRAAARLFDRARRGLLASIAERLTALRHARRHAARSANALRRLSIRASDPGGVISNLKFQLGELRQAHRIDEVIAECAAIHAELGLSGDDHPVLAIRRHPGDDERRHRRTVPTGDRRAHPLRAGDLWPRFRVRGHGPDLKDRLLGSQRARELAELDAHAMQPASVKQYRETYGGAGVSDEEFLLRVIMQGTNEIDAMRASGPAAASTSPAKCRWCS